MRPEELVIGKKYRLRMRQGQQGGTVDRCYLGSTRNIKQIRGLYTYTVGGLGYDGKLYVNGEEVNAVPEDMWLDETVYYDFSKKPSGRRSNYTTVTDRILREVR